MANIQLRHVARSRSGDKGNTVNIVLIASNANVYEAITKEVTAERVKAHFAGIVEGPITRHLVPGLLAMNFVCKGALSGGGSASLRLDNLGKCFASNLLRLEVEIDEGTPLSNS